MDVWRQRMNVILSETVISMLVEAAIFSPHVRKDISQSAHAQNSFYLTPFPVYVTIILNHVQTLI
jgi:hypothetical protein